MALTVLPCSIWSSTDDRASMMILSCISPVSGVNATMAMALMAVVGMVSHVSLSIMMCMIILLEWCVVCFCAEISAGWRAELLFSA